MGAYSKKSFTKTTTFSVRNKVNFLFENKTSLEFILNATKQTKIIKKLYNDDDDDDKICKKK